MSGNRLLAFLLRILMLVLLVCSSLLAQSTQLLESHFRDKVFVIRGFYRENGLAYDAEGNVQGKPSIGPWSLALFRIEKVETRDGKLVFEGPRLAARFDQDQRTFVNVIPEQPETIHIEVEVGNEALSDTALADLGNRIFLQHVSKETVPECWQDFIATRYVVWPAHTPANQATESGGQPALRLTTGRGAITPPLVLTMPRPQYEQIAKQAKFQGISVLQLVVNKAGVPERIRIQRPLGMGLDEKAIEAVSTWRFTPATLNGQPVPVLISVEVAFRLF